MNSNSCFSRKIKFLFIIVVALISGCSIAPLVTPESGLQEDAKKLEALIYNPENGQIDNKNISVSLENNNNLIKISFDNNILFDINKYQIKNKYKPTLKKIASYLLENQDFRIQVDGHTDSTGDVQYNKKLSKKRANAVKDILIYYRISSNRIKAIGWGEINPKYSNDNLSGRRKNRRAEIRLTKSNGKLLENNISKESNPYQKPLKSIGDNISWNLTKKIDTEDCLSIFFIIKTCMWVTYKFKFTGEILSINKKTRTYQVNVIHRKIETGNFVSRNWYKYKEQALSWMNNVEFPLTVHDHDTIKLDSNLPEMLNNESKLKQEDKNISINNTPKWLNRSGWVSSKDICEYKKTYITEMKNVNCNKKNYVTGKSNFSSWAGYITHIYYNARVTKGQFSKPKIKVTWITDKSRYKCGQIIQKNHTEIRDFTHRSIKMRQCKK